MPGINSKTGMRFVPLSSAPATNAGRIYFDSVFNKLRYYNGTSWVSM